MPTAPFVPVREGSSVPGLAADEPDRAGMIIAVAFVLITLLAVTLALGYALLFS